MKPQTRRSLDFGPLGGRVVLYFWSADEQPRVENLVALHPDGTTRWRAALPLSPHPDCFTDMKRDGGAVVAKTWRGASLRFDALTGVREVG